MTRSTFRRLIAIAVVLGAVHVVLTMELFAEDHAWIFYGSLAEGAIYALAAFAVARDAGDDRACARDGLLLIVGVAVILRGMLLFAPPVSTDIYRYIWDGRVQNAGINPYLYVPADPALMGLRDGAIFPSINRATYAPTIYPPLAQIVFALVARLSGTATAMKAAMVGFEALAAVAILRLLARRRLPAHRLLLYLWHPLPIWEFAGSGHVDAVAIACVMLALLAAEARRPVLAGLALGGATLVKFFPLVVGPALWQRWDWRLPAAGLLTLVLLYLPYLGAGSKVFGFLGGYSDEEGLKDGSGLYLWLLLKAFVPAVPPGAVVGYLPLAGLVLLGAGLAILFRRDRTPTIGGAALLATGFVVLSSPHYPWYLALLVPFLCFVPSLAILYITAASPLIYIAGFPPDVAVYSLLYLPFFALLALDARHRLTRRAGRPSSLPAS